MSFLPAWAPGIHPLIIHFPLAILPLAILFDAASLFIRRHGWLRIASLGLYVLGTLAAIAAVISGEQGADGLLVTAGAANILEAHEEWAELTMWFFVVFTLGRGAIHRWNLNTRMIVKAAMVAVSLVGLFLLVETGEHGAELVYSHGVGVGVVENSEATPHDHNAHGAGSDTGSDHDDGHDHDHEH